MGNAALMLKEHALVAYSDGFRSRAIEAIYPP
jgi:hypothetical protein